MDSPSSNPIHVEMKEKTTRMQAHNEYGFLDLGSSKITGFSTVKTTSFVLSISATFIFLEGNHCWSNDVSKNRLTAKHIIAKKKEGGPSNSGGAWKAEMMKNTPKIMNKIVKNRFHEGGFSTTIGVS